MGTSISSDRAASRLCKSCQKIAVLGETRTAWPCPLVPDSSAPIRLPCQGCEILYEAAAPLKRPNGTIKGRMGDSEKGSYLIANFDEEFIVYYYAIRDTPNPWNLTLVDSPLQEPDFAATISQASSWLNHCLEYHKLCRYTSDPVLPTRVLDLGSSTSDDTITLWERPSGQRGRYACLSYCWGNSAFIKTTTTTIDDHREGISLHKLPQTFRDVIRVTRALGVRYLWIDALCIIQDSSEDWDAESGKMADIYRNSYLTLAATRAASVDEGCFAAPGEGVQVGPVMSQAMHVLPSWRPVYEENQKLPLFTRAWAYQERILAPRVLHFGSEEVVWDCLHGRQYQQSYLPHLTSGRSDKVIFHDSIHGSDDNRTLSGYWRRIVTTYSPLQLTVAADKLPAISGLAEEMRRRTGWAYLAGLWRETLLYDMCWHRKETSNYPPPPSPARAPTWSWASIDGQITFAMFYSEFLKSEYAQVLDAECVLMGPSPTGQVKGGFVKLKGYLLDVSYTPGKHIIYIEGKSARWRPDGRGHKTAPGPLYAVPMIKALDILYFIVLQPTRPGETEEFIRVGMACYGRRSPQVWAKRQQTIRII